MPKKVREVLDMLNRDGWTFLRQRGSHQQFKHPLKSGLVTVAGKPSSDLAEGTYRAILKQAGMKK